MRPSPRVGRIGLLWLVVAFLAPAPGAGAHAQVPRSVPTRVVGAVDVELAETYTTISALRELADGRVLVGDAREITVKLADFTTRKTVAVGKRGPGPEEYSSVGALLAARGDTTWLVNAAMGRMLIITPAGQVGGSFLLSTEPGGVRETVGPAGRTRSHFRLILSPSFSDSTGRLYGSSAVVQPTPMPPTGRVTRFAHIRRWDRTSGTLETIDSIGSDHILGSQGRVQTRSPAPFGPRDEWVVAPDGTIIIVRAADYHLTWISPSGAVVRSAPIPHQRRAVTAEDRRDVSERRRGPVSDRLAALAPTFNPNVPIPDDSWPSFKAPVSGEPHLAPDGRIWIPLTPARRGDPLTYDVVEKGRGLVERVALPPRTILIGFGRQSVYTARIDDDDLQYLQRRKLRD